MRWRFLIRSRWLIGKGFFGVEGGVCCVRGLGLRGAGVADRFGCSSSCAGIRVLSSRRGRFGLLVLLLASGYCLCALFGRPPLCVCLFAGIRVLLACFTRRPCAGRHLLFFAAAKKSRQKKAAHTANISHCLRAPTGSYASHGDHVTHVGCQRSCGAPHPLRPPALHHAVPDSPRPPRWQTVCRP